MNLLPPKRGLQYTTGCGEHRVCSCLFSKEIGRQFILGRLNEVELNLNELQRNVRHGKTPGGSEGVKNQSADSLGCYSRPWTSRPRKTKRMLVALCA